MKETKKIPLWPLYLADAMMFATVFLIALPSIRYSESMSVGQTLLCCIMVLAAMGLMLVPYWLESKSPSKPAKADDAEDPAENFKIIFDELAALRLMIAEGEERVDAMAEKFDASDADQKFKVFEAAVVEFRDSVKTKLRELNESIDSNAMALSACESFGKDAKAEIDKLAAEIKSAKDAADKHAADIENRFEMIIEERAEPKAEDESDSKKFGAQPKFGEMLTKALSGSETAKTAVRKFVSMNRNFDSVISEDGNILGKEDQTASNVIPGQGKVEMPDSAHLVNECLPESQSEFDPCRKPQPEDEAVVEEAEAEAEESDSAAETAQEADEEFENAINEISAAPSEKEKKTEDEDPDFFEQADSGLNGCESAAQTETAAQTVSEKETVADDAQGTFLLDNVPESKIKKPEKKDAVITVNALIGIGNKPYLRGNGADLSLEKGLAMEFVEIGKWRHVIPELSEPITFTVLKNDEQPDDDGKTYTIKAGEKLELNLSFPIG